ncbi:MAG: LamG-like jellyroll fold domain-containing protein [Armatimonadota bacterium]
MRSLNWVLVSLLGMLALSLPSLAADKALYKDAFAAGDTKGWTLQPPINAIGPITANGTWKTAGKALVATGTAAPWTIQTAGNANWTDYKLSTKITIRKPGPKSDFPIASWEFDRYLAREDYPVGQHAGIYRFRYYAGEFDWGSDAAVYLRYQDRGNCYRVQLSAEYQEMILWHSVGGYLQVVPCKVEPGKTYKLDILAQGSHFQVLLDGKKTIDYRHTCLPTLKGGIGLAAYNSTVAFQEVNVTTLSAAPPAPEHQPRFAHRLWRGLHWVFDGNEPIVELEQNPGENDYSGGTLAYNFVKLRPGYRPLYYCGINVRMNDQFTTRIANMDAIKYTGNGTERLLIDFDGYTAKKDMLSHHTDTITYDRIRGTYRHDFDVDVHFTSDQNVRGLEFADPLTYNNKEPGRAVKYRWLPAGHAWGVFRNEDNTIRRHPISQSLDIEGQNRWFCHDGDGFWMLYPDRAVCPVFEHNMPGYKTNIGVCHWGYDWHQYVWWGDKARPFKKDEHFTIKFAFAGYPPTEGEQLFLKSTLHPQMTEAEVPDKVRSFMKLPSAYAYPVADPAGTSFEQLFSVREPYIGWQFYGDYTNDREVGRTDHYSLRLDGPAKATGLIYHHMLDGYGKHYLCTVWLKTQGVKGNLKVILRYPWNPKVPADVITTGLTGDNDWQEISFISDLPVILPDRYDATDFVVELNGTGTVWVDDFSLRPIEEGEKVVEKRPAPKPPVALTPSADYVMYLPCNEGIGFSCGDASNHGNNLKLKGATWVKTEKRSVLHFEKGASAFIPMLSPELSQQPGGKYPHASMTIDAWVRPTAGKDGGDIIGYWYSPRIYLTPASAADKKNFKVNALLLAGDWNPLTSTNTIPGDQWSHIAVTLAADNKAVLYVNGKPVADKTLKDKMTYAYFGGVMSVGTYGMLYAPSYNGDLAEIRWWSRTATPAEIAAAAANQP